MWFTAGLFIGVIALFIIRLATYMPEMVHYHANFAVFINGKREEFKDPRYYQEVAICSATSGINIPQQRAHLHDEHNALLHVHDHATTWGQFFANIGWSVGIDFVQTDDGTMYRADDDNKLHVLINGQDYTDISSIANMIIKDKSKLLLSYGNGTTKSLADEAKIIPSTAVKADATVDPASCSGAEKLSFKQKLHHLL